MSTADITISEEQTGSKGRYIATVAGHDEPGEMTYSRLGESRIIIDHTGVPDSLRGLGVGQALAVHAVEEARKAGLKIVPLCPFFRSQAERHPDWADVVDL